jgi:hypothetical protein
MAEAVRNEQRFHELPILADDTGAGTARVLFLSNQPIPTRSTRMENEVGDIYPLYHRDT